MTIKEIEKIRNEIEPELSVVVANELRFDFKQARQEESYLTLEEIAEIIYDSFEKEDLDKLIQYINDKDEPGIEDIDVLLN